MTIPASLIQRVEGHIGSIERTDTLGGGCIAHATRVISSAGAYFLKWGDTDVSRTFEAEALGLRTLARAARSLRVPEVAAIELPVDDAPGYLLMEWVEEGRPRQGFWQAFGRALAELHAVEGEEYGFEKDNFIGRLPQYNTPADDWPTFYLAQRLRPQVDLARRSGRWKSEWDTYLSALEDRLSSILPRKPARSILHGDLWSGNYLVDAEGHAVLIDPAVYHGDRETDLAMMQLFGGFDRALFDAYESEWPIEPGWAERRAVYQLYHLINHLNHFGGSYAGSVAATLRQF